MTPVQQSLDSQHTYRDVITVTGGFDCYRLGFQDGPDFDVLHKFTSLNHASATACLLRAEAEFLTDQLVRRLRPTGGVR